MQSSLLADFQALLDDNHRWTLAEITDAIALKDEASLALIARALSLDPNLLRALLAKKKGDTAQFFASLAEICRISGCDADIASFIAALALSRYNPEA